MLISDLIIAIVATIFVAAMLFSHEEEIEDWAESTRHK